MANVLIVEDDPAIQRLLNRFLSTTGYELSFAATAHTALTIAENTQPQVVISDLHLTDSANGLWLLERVRERCPATAMILATGDAAVSPIESLRPGVIAYLVKPLQRDDVLNAVKDGIAWSTAEAKRRRMLNP